MYFKKLFFQTLLRKGIPWCASGCVLALISSSIHAQPAPLRENTTDCTQHISIHCGSTPSLISHAGRTWAIFAQRNHLYLTRSGDLGKSWSPPVQVTPAPEHIETNGENRPKIAATQRALVLSWTQKTDGRYTGDIRFTRSTDGGRSFTQPRTINDDGLLTSHRFDSLSASSGGQVALVWLDKRDKVKAENNGKDYAGSAVYLAISDDHGASFARNRPIAHHSCECCRVALAPERDGGFALFWRHIFDGQFRDHAFARVSAKGEIESVARATVDQWRIDACPHHGPDMASSDRPELYHLAWFSNGDHHSGIYYGQRNTSTGTTERVTRMDASASAAHPQVLEHENRVYFAWQHFDGDEMQIQLKVSNDQGESWSEARSIAATTGQSDHPALVILGDAPFLAWHTQAEGLRLVAVDEQPIEAGMKHSVTEAHPL